MNSFERLSYLQSNESDLDFSTIINPCKSLTEVFNSVCEEVDESEHLKVYLRIRPLLSEENITSQDGNIEILNKKNILLTAPSGSHAFKSKPIGITKVAHKFTFSHVYGQESTQKDLFEDSAQDLVKELVNGQNCLLFTYGATNSGKTYTIQGTNASPGLLPRTLATLFKLIGDQQYIGNDLKPQHFCGVVRLTNKEIIMEEEFKENLFKIGSLRISLSKSTSSLESRLSKDTEISSIDDCSIDTDGSRNSDAASKCESIFDGIVDDSNAIYIVFLSFAEIYNEYIYDLLDRTTLSKKHKKSPLVLGEDRNGAIYVKGLREVRVKSAEEALQILEVGKQSLHFAATKLNHHSSRSHCIFTLKLIRLADPSHPHVARVSMLSLCDLAGAERASKTLNSVDRLKEASNINTSLLVLGRCLTALRQNQMVSKQVCGPRKSVPIPYRDSKVTRLFQSFFMGKGKVALIVNISMSNLLFDETLKVLKFSALASKVTITQEKPQLIDQSIEYKPKRNSQFSRFLRQSLNMSTSSSRLSVPWCNQSSEITFGGMEENDNKMLAVPEEADEEEEEEEEDERYEALIQLIGKLKDKLVSVSVEKAQLESKLRNELCDAFSKKIVQIEESWRNRLEEQEARDGEYMKWRMNHVLKSVKMKGASRKRLRSENDDDEEMVPSIHLVREEIKVKQLEDEKLQLEDEINALKTSLKSQIQATKTAQEEKSKLRFQLAENSRLLSKAEEEKEEAESFLKSPSSLSSEAAEQLVVGELHNKIQILENTLLDKNKELKEVKDMLLEAADDFIDKECQIESLKEKVAKQAVMMQELESQLNETKHMIGSQQEYLEEREEEIHDLRKKIFNTEVVDLENTYEDKKPTEEEMDSILREKSELLIELENAKTELEKVKQLRTKEKDCNKELIEDKNDLETELDNLKSELVALHKKYMNLETENSELRFEIGELDSRLSENEKHDDDEENAEVTNLKLEALEEELMSTTTKFEESVKRNNELLDEVAAYQCQKKMVEESNKNLVDKFNNVNAENELLQIKIAELEVCLNKVDEAKDKEMQEDNDLKKILVEKEKKLATVSLMMEEMSKEIDVYERKFENFEESLVLKEQIEKECWEQVNAMREMCDKHTSENEGKEKEIEDLTEKLLKKTEECEGLEEQGEKECWKQVNAMREICDKHTSEKEEKEKEIEDLTEKLLKKTEEWEGLLVEKQDILNLKNEMQENLKNLEEKYVTAIADQKKMIDELTCKATISEEAYDTIQTSKKDTENALTNVSNDYKACLQKMEEEKNQCGKLTLAISDLKEKNANLIEKMNSMTLEENSLKNQIRDLNNAMSNAEIIKLTLIEKELKLEEDKARAYSRVQNLQSSIEEKEEVMGKLNGKIEHLDRKVNSTEEEMEQMRTKCHMFEKEIAALREARSEEIGNLRAEIDEKENSLQQKEREINGLQQEIKRLLQMTVSDFNDTGKTSSEIVDLKEQIRIIEMEKSTLIQQVSTLQHEISCFHDCTKSTQDSFQNNDIIKTEKVTIVVKNSETSEVESISNETPMEGNLKRSTRNRRTKKEFENFVTPDNLKLKLDIFGEDFSTSLPRNTSTKSRRGGRTQKSQKSNVAESPDFKVPTQSRKKNQSCRFDLDEDDKEDIEYCTDDDDYIPETKPKSKRTTRTRAKSTTKPYNPHLENKENSDCLKNSNNESIEEKQNLLKPDESCSTRRRGRRPLYKLNFEEPFECSPNLIPDQRKEDSPHTIVKKKLRSKLNK